MNKLSYTPSFTSRVIIDPECFQTDSKRIRRYLASSDFRKGIEQLRSNGQNNTVTIAPGRPNYILTPLKSDLKRPVCMIFKNIFRKDMRVELMTGTDRSLILQHSILRSIYMNKTSMLRLPFRWFVKAKKFLSI